MGEIDDTRTIVERFGESAGPPPRRDLAGPAPGSDMLGRYTILEQVGVGGMGVVFAAYDRTLDRKVALKVLRTEEGRFGEGQRRMLGEAQALARLSHPNVVKVFDVGTWSGRVYISMEFVDGDTLDGWAERAAPSWREMLAVLVAASRGLAASHAAGLVHRDVKPGNVLVSDAPDGRGKIARVVDFGIAQATEVASEAPDLRDSEEGSGLSSSLNLTETGAVMGTPAYMAPEQHLGEPVDAASDQFSFCVTAYRMLYGTKPFRGRSLRQLRRSVLIGEVAPAPAGTKVPTAVRRVLLRGLAVKPARRWPSMAALGQALERAALRRSRWALGLAGAMVAAGLVALAVVGDVGGPRCDDGVQRLAGVWDPPRREAVATAFSHSALAYADDARERVTERLDAYADEWTRSYTQICEHGREDEATTLDARMACLREHRAQMSALVDELASADDAVIERATKAAAELSPVVTCVDAHAGPADWAVAEADAPRVEGIRDLLAAADAASAAGRFDRAAELADDAWKEADQVGHRPLATDAKWRRGLARAQGGDLEPGVEDLTTAAYEAVELGLEDTAARAATRAAFMLGYRLARYDEAMRWARHAQAAVDRLGDEGPLRADMLEALGAIQMAKGQYAEARAVFEPALKLREALYGEDHDKTAMMHNNLGAALLGAGDHVAATAHLEAAIAIWERVHGPRHPHVASSLTGLAVAYEAGGELEAARRTHAHAIELKEELFGPDHDSLAVSLDNLGSVLVRLGRYEEGRAYSARALNIRERSFGPEHPHVASSLVNIGLADERLGRLGPAATSQRRALRIFEMTVGPDHPFVAFPLTSLGRIALGEGRIEDALARLERAMKLRESTGSALERAETRFALGRAKWAAGRATEGRSTVERARVDLGDTPGTDRLRGEITQWLGAHASP